MIDMNIILCITEFPLAKTPLQSLYQWILTQPPAEHTLLEMESSETGDDEQPEPDSTPTEPTPLEMESSETENDEQPESDSTPTEPDSIFNINEDFIIPEQLQERFVNLSKLTIDNNK